MKIFMWVLMVQVSGLGYVPTLEFNTVEKCRTAITTIAIASAEYSEADHLYQRVPMFCVEIEK